MDRVAEADITITQAGNFPLTLAQSDHARLWEVEIWPRNGQLFSPQGYTPANYAAFFAVVDVDGPISQRVVAGVNVSSGRNWLVVGPRGARLTVFGKAVTVQIEVTSSSPGVIATAPPMIVAARVNPINAPKPGAQSVLCYSRGVLNGYGQATQFPAFSTMFRLYGGNGPQSVFSLCTNVVTAGLPTTLVDPFTAEVFANRMCGIASDWQPLHPYAAGIVVDGGTIIETR